MERSGVTPPGAVAAPDLADVLSAGGPYLSLYLTTEAGIDNASYRSEQRWKTLRGDLADLVAVVEGGRSEDGSGEQFAEAVREQVTALVNRDMVELLGKFRGELGQGDRAADGPDDTLAALSRAQVEVLLVADSPDDSCTALFGPEPTQVGREADTLRAMGVDDPGTAPLADVAVRAALGTGAAVEIVPAGDLPTGRLGAILRWS